MSINIVSTVTWLTRRNLHVRFDKFYLAGFSGDIRRMHVFRTGVKFGHISGATAMVWVRDPKSKGSLIG